MRHKQLYIAASLFIVLIACDESITPLNPEDNCEDMVISSISRDNPFRISADKQEISEEDASTIASNLEYEKFTRSTDRRIINSIFPINDDKGKPLLYAVNFKDNKGFILVSASKDYYPILADTEQGNLTSDLIDSGLYGYIEDYKTIISHKGEKTEAEVEIIRNNWLRFEEKISSGSSVKTRATDAQETLFWNQCDQWIANMEMQGYEVFPLLNYPDEMTSSMFSIFSSQAQNSINPGFNYLDHSFIAVTHSGVKTQVGPLLLPTWGQDSPYNDYLPTGVTLGCGTVALAQIMRYYEWPNSFAWSQMPLYSASNTTKQFLSDLHYQTSSNSGESNIAYIYSKLQSFGYEADIDYYYNVNYVLSSINAGKPVYMRGQDQYLTEAGHAWVCCGHKSRNENYNFYLYVPISAPGKSNLIMSNVYSDSNAIIEPLSLYMNWGWGGNHNGWFVNPNAQVNGHDFTYYRMLIYNISIDSL